MQYAVPAHAGLVWGVGGGQRETSAGDQAGVQEEAERELAPLAIPTRHRGERRRGSRPGPFAGGLRSVIIDLDRNDYWVWSKIDRYRPRVVVIEYNAIFPPGCHWVVDYRPQAVWDKTSNFGASLT